MNVYVRKKSNYYAPIIYVLKIIEKNRCIKLTYLESTEDAHIIWDDTSNKSEIISHKFYNYIKNDKRQLKHQKLFNFSLMIKDESGNDDLIATIFYMINCLQEIEPDEIDLDQFNRFKYTSSYQARFNNIQINLVEQLINSFCIKHGIKGSLNKSTFFISHDIDTLYGSILQDGFWAFKKLRIGVILNLITLELSRKPHWKNIDQIIKINDEYDIRTTFFWLVNKGKGSGGIINSDYNLKNEYDLLDKVVESNNTNGLHKSCSTMSINEEIKKGNLNTTYNRFHFLNFLPHKDWHKISDSILDFDCSLGFAEQYGFRNSYGKAFQPFNIDQNRPYDFVEIPLNFMDVTFHKYMKIQTNKIGNTIIDFYEKNSTNCNFSLLWHNTYFTDYKFSTFVDEYKKVLSFIYENKVECIGPKEIIENNKLEW